MDIFNRKKLNELFKIIRGNEGQIKNLELIISDLRKELNTKSNQIHSILNEKEELSLKLQTIQSNNLRMSSDLSKLNRVLELSDVKKNEELVAISKFYDEKIKKLNVEFEHGLDIAKHYRFKELPSQIEKDIQKIISEKEIGFPWLANAIADYYENLDNIYSSYLERKKRPAIIQAERIKEISKEKTLFKKEYLIMKYTIKYYEGLFPWLSEYVGINSDALIEALHSEKRTSENEDPVLNYIQRGEYLNLNVSERNQKALDRYWSSNKTPWQIGRDYERYIGYLYEIDGYQVQYFGIEKGLEDLGRDLICVKDGITEVVQCKYWSKVKNIPIRENHINQLFGTTVKHHIDHSIKEGSNLHTFLDDYSKGKILGTIVTSTVLSETALQFSKTLKIKVKQEVDLNYNYPSIKCNINPVTKEKIYHLPFDQQYDNTRINFKSGEFYAKTVLEAEKKGFRRAFKWLSD